MNNVKKLDLSKKFPLTPIALEEVSTCSQGNFCISTLEEFLSQFSNPLQSRKNDFYQILYITEGEGSLVIDFHELPISSHRLFFIAPGQVYQMKLKNTRGISIIFSKDIFSLVDSNPNYLKNLPYFHSVTCEPSVQLYGQGIQDISESIHRLFTAFRKSVPDPIGYIRAHLRILLIDILNYFPCRSPSWEMHEPMRRFELLLEEKFRDWKNPSRYAFELGISTNHLNYLCKNTSGKTAGDLIRNRIVLEAKKLLLHTNKSILEISNDLNFEDPAYFSRFFKKYENVSPEKYRLMRSAS